MGVWMSLRIALRALGRNKMRTGLTMLGMIIGVGAVIAMVSMGAGAKVKVAASINSLGTNLLMVTPGSPRMRFGPMAGGGGGAGAAVSLTEDDAKAIARHFPQTVAALAPIARGGITVKLADKKWDTSVQGTTPEYKQVNNAALSQGRFITQSDVDGRVKVAVLGPTVVEELLGNPAADVVGMSVQINRVPFKVVGVLRSKGSGAGGMDQDDMVIVPVTTALRRILNRDNLSMIAITAASAGQMDLVTEQVARLLRQRHRLRPPFPDNDDFDIHSQTSIMEAAETAIGTMTNLMGGIAVVSLLVGGIGIMNIMLVSVSERTREIGLRKAVGATNRDVLTQFMIESCVISVVGGLLGVAVGGLGAHFLGQYLQTDSIVTMQSVLLAVGVAAGIGIFFGIYPAYKASQLNPIEALRYE